MAFAILCLNRDVWKINNKYFGGIMMGKLHITDIQILRRTFEGKTDPSKNDDALTSKYSPSKRYLLRYRCTEYGDHCISEAYETKRLAEYAVELLLKYNFNQTEKSEFSFQPRCMRNKNLKIKGAKNQ
jgi:hypothetical protein